MDKELRILILEDVPADAELEEYKLRKAGLVFTSKIVDTREAFLKELDEFSPDLILSDYKLPSFDGLAALRIAKEKCPDVPFILVTGKLGEEFAIEKLKEGATDYVLKNNLERLVPSVNRALEEAKLITERKRAEESLRASKLIIEGIINAIPVRVFWKDKNLVYLGCNAIFARDAGFKDPKDVIGKDDYQMGWRDQAELYRADDRYVIESGYSKLLIEELQTTPEGNTITLLTSKIPLRSSGGEISGVLGTYMDITERKRTEKLINDALTFNKTIFETSPIGIITYKASGQCVSVNESIAKMVGATVDQLLKQNFYHLESWKKSGMLELAEEVLATGIEKRKEVHVVSTFGKGVWFACRFVPFQFEDEPHLLALFTDITELKMEQKALIESEQKLRNIIEHSNELYYVHDTKHVLSYVSPQSLQVLGYTPDEIMIEWTRLTTDNPINEKGVEITEKTLRTGDRQPPYLLELYRKDRSKVLLEIDESPIKDNKGNVVGMVGAARDITERWKAEEEIKKRVKELEDFYEMAVGRELRMIELKEQIESLKEELEAYKKQ